MKCLNDYWLFFFCFLWRWLQKLTYENKNSSWKTEICHDANLSSLGTPQIVIQRASSAANDIKAYSQSSVLVLHPSFLLLFMKKNSYLYFRIGRRYPLAAFHLIAGIPLFILLGIPVTTSTYSQNISNHSLCNIHIFSGLGSQMFVTDFVITELIVGTSFYEQENYSSYFYKIFLWISRILILVIVIPIYIRIHLSILILTNLDRFYYSWSYYNQHYHYEAFCSNLPLLVLQRWEDFFVRKK